MRSMHALAALLFCLACGLALAGPDRGRPSSIPMPGARGAPEEALVPDFTLRSMDGEEVALSRFLGKKAVLLVFWATWCPECKAAIPEINAMNDGQAGKKMRILGLDFRESREKVAAAVTSRGIRYTVLLDDKGTAARAFGVVGIPTYILISREGEVVYRGNVLPGDIDRYL